MSQVPGPQGLRVAYHRSGDVRILELVDGILSGYASNIFTGSPVKMFSDGTINVMTTTVADPILGIFAGCEYTRPDGSRYLGPMWASGATYVAKSMKARIVAIDDPGIVLIGQTKASVALINRGEGINLGDNVQGSTFTGQSSQGLGAPTGNTAGSFKLLDLVQQPDNDWGDPYVWVYVEPASFQQAAI